MKTLRVRLKKTIWLDAVKRPKDTVIRVSQQVADALMQQGLANLVRW